MLAFEFAMPNLYFRIGFIGALALNIIFWLSAWAWGASIASLYLGWGGFDSSAGNKWGSSLAAASALGAFTWYVTSLTRYIAVSQFFFFLPVAIINQSFLNRVLNIVILVFFVIFSSRDSHDTSANNAELGHVQTQTAEQKAYDNTQQPPQQQYQQQPYQQQQQYPPQNNIPQEQHYQQPPQ